MTCLNESTWSYPHLALSKRRSERPVSHPSEFWPITSEVWTGILLVWLLFYTLAVAYEVLVAILGILTYRPHIPSPEEGAGAAEGAQGMEPGEIVRFCVRVR